MKDLLIPVTDLNSVSYKILSWLIPDGEKVAEGQKIAEIETSKSVFDLFSPCSGFLLQALPAGDENPVDEPAAQLFPDLKSLEDYKKNKAHSQTAFEKIHATSKAKILAEKNHLDLSVLGQGRLITEKDVENYLKNKKSSAASALPAKTALKTEAGVERVLLIGGGLGATQVIDIFRDTPEKKAVAILDDDSRLWNTEVFGVPVIGGTDRLKELFQAKVMDCAIISISTSIEARTKFRKCCQELGIPLTNAIDKTCKIAQEARFGSGNVICAFCHFGAAAVVGDNNFISAYNSFDHHCKLGSDISTGPGCMASGIVTIGSRVRMGTGIFIQPYLEIGDDVRIASGAVILQPVPSGYAVKTRVTTSIAPA